MMPTPLPKAQPTHQPDRLAFFNLVAYLPEPNRHNAVRAVIDNITAKLPARVITIGIEEKATGPLCVQKIPHILTRGTSQIASEEIVIHSSEEELPKVPFALMPYLLPDLPIYLLWDQNPLTDQTVLPHLVPFATRLIFNADASCNWVDFSQSMLKSLSTNKLEIMDINWAMIGCWRDAFVRLFHTPTAIEQLRYCQQLKIAYSGSSCSDTTQSVYLCNWLAAQLGWDFKDLQTIDGNLQASYSHAKGPVEVYFQAIPKDPCPAGMLLSVEVTTGDNTSYTLKRHPQSDTVVVHIGYRDTCQLPFTLPLPALLRSLTYIKELFHYTSGSHYPNMLRHLASFSASTGRAL